MDEATSTIGPLRIRSTHARTQQRTPPHGRGGAAAGRAAVCFACGQDNPIGFRLDDIRREGDQVHATLHSRPEYQGYPGVLHGGLSATALDEEESNMGGIL